MCVISYRFSILSSPCCLDKSKIPNGNCWSEKNKIKTKVPPVPHIHRCVFSKWTARESQTRLTALQKRSEGNKKKEKKKTNKNLKEEEEEREEKRDDKSRARLFFTQ